MHKSKSCTFVAKPLDNIAQSIKKSIDVDLQKLSMRTSMNMRYKNAKDNLVYKNRINDNSYDIKNIKNSDQSIYMNKHPIRTASSTLLLNKYCKNNNFAGNTLKQIANNKCIADSIFIRDRQYTETTATVHQSAQLQADPKHRSWHNKSGIQLEYLRDKQKQIHMQIGELETNIKNGQSSKQVDMSTAAVGIQMKTENKTKSHHILLSEYDELNNQLQQQVKQLAKNKQQLQQLNNRAMMLHQQQVSQQYHKQSLLSEQQYIQQLLTVYKHEYSSQQQTYSQILHRQNQVIRVLHEIECKQQAIATINKQMVAYKSETEYQLHDTICKKRIGELRRVIIGCYQEADQYRSKININIQHHSGRNIHCGSCDDNSNNSSDGHKIWEILCEFVRQKSANSKINIQQHGIQAWLCSNGLIQEWHQYLSSYIIPDTQLTYPPKLIQKYIHTLTKLQTLLNNPKLQQQKCRTQLYIHTIKQMNSNVVSLRSQYQQNEQQIANLQQSMQNQFGQQVMATIKYLQQQKTLNHSIYNYVNISSDGRSEDESLLNLNTIKSTLKQLRKKRDQRLSKIAAFYQRLFEITSMNKLMTGNTMIRYMNEKQQLSNVIGKKSMQVKILAGKVQSLEDKKIKIENKINDVIDKWGELDANKQTLKNCYRQLNKINKSIDALRITHLHNRIESSTEVAGWSKRIIDKQLNKSDRHYLHNQNKLLTNSKGNLVKDCELRNTVKVGNVQKVQPQQYRSGQIERQQQLGEQWSSSSSKQQQNKQNIFKSVNSSMNKNKQQLSYVKNNNSNSPLLHTCKRSTKSFQHNNDADQHRFHLQTSITRKPSPWKQRLTKCTTTLGIRAPLKLQHQHQSLTAMLLSKLAK